MFLTGGFRSAFRPVFLAWPHTAGRFGSGSCLPGRPLALEFSSSFCRRFWRSSMDIAGTKSVSILQSTLLNRAHVDCCGMVLRIYMVRLLTGHDEHCTWCILSIMVQIQMVRFYMVHR